MPVQSRGAALGREFERLYTENFAFAWRMLLHFYQTSDSCLPVVGYSACQPPDDQSDYEPCP